jgi:2-phospho-L-lactate guanylyltransferase
VIFALLPVKAPKNAKQRLRGFLTPEQRERLARAMFEQVLGTLCTVEGLARVVVVTSDETAADRARSRSVEVFEETEQHSHSVSADLAARRAMELGATTVMLIPIDIPLVTRQEIESLIAELATGLIIVPSADGTGTNALVRTPPDVIQSCFGPDSFRKHVEQAEAAGVPVKVIRPPGMVFDIDTPEDIAELLERAPSSSIAQLLARR